MLRAVMPWLALVLALGPPVVLMGCKSEYVVYEGIGCTTSDNADPKYTCASLDKLVCIATYNIAVTKEKLARKYDGGLRPIYVCRVPCSPDGAAQSECPAGEVCCAGHIYGPTYQKTGGCTPPSFCNDLPASATPDGGPRITDAGDARDATADVPVDAATVTDGGAMDSAVAGDRAPVDAASDGAAD